MTKWNFSRINNLCLTSTDVFWVQEPLSRLPILVDLAPPEILSDRPLRLSLASFVQSWSLNVVLVMIFSWFAIRPPQIPSINYTTSSNLILCFDSPFVLSEEKILNIFCCSKPYCAFDSVVVQSIFFFGYHLQKEVG